MRRKGDYRLLKGQLAARFSFGRIHSNGQNRSEDWPFRQCVVVILEIWPENGSAGQRIFLGSTTGRGQNRTLRLLLALWPPEFTGQQDVGQELWLDCQPGVFPLSARFAEVDGIPVDDDGGEKVEPGHAVLLPLDRAVTDFALAPDPECEAQPVVSPAPHPDLLDVVVGQRVMA